MAEERNNLDLAKRALLLEGAARYICGQCMRAGRETAADRISLEEVRATLMEIGRACGDLQERVAGLMEDLGGVAVKTAGKTAGKTVSIVSQSVSM